MPAHIIPAHPHRRTLSRKSKSSMSKPRALRKQQASSLPTLLTNTPNLPARANQSTRCRCTRSTSRLAVYLIAPSDNSGTATIINSAHHTTSQRRMAVPPVHRSSRLPLLSCRLRFSSTLTSFQEVPVTVPQTSHTLSRPLAPATRPHDFVKMEASHNKSTPDD
jgi:hypothetical protein